MNADLNLILSEYLANRDAGAAPRLADLVSQYPEHAEELNRFVLYSDVVGTLEPMARDDPAAESRFAEAASLTAERLRAAGVGVTAPLGSITKQAETEGLTVRGLAERLGLSVSFVARLDQRLFTPAGIPRELIERLGTALNRGFDEIRGYLALPPRMASDGVYKSQIPPAIKEQADFRDTVRTALDLSEEQKSAWLVEPLDGSGSEK